MKIRMKVFTVSFAAVLFIVLAGCSVRRAVSPDTFKSKAEKNGFNVSEETSPYNNVNRYLVAAKSGSDTKLLYFSFSDSSSAHDMYAAAIGDIIPSGSKDTVDSDTYNKYSVSRGELYYTITRMDNTIIYCTATVSKKDEAVDFMKAVKY